MWQVQETPVGHGKYRESLEPHRPPLSLEVHTWTGHRTAQPQHRPVPGAAQGGRADSKQTQCQHGLFSPLSWLTTVGQAALLLKALPGFMHYILPVGNGNVSPGKWKKFLQPLGSTVGRKCIYKFPCYLSNCFSTHFAMIQEEKAFLHNDMTPKHQRIHVRLKKEEQSLP